MNHQLGDMSHHKRIFINPSLTKKRKHKFRREQRKETEVPHTEPQIEEHIPTPSHDPLPSVEDRMKLSELMKICTKLSDRVLSLEQIKTNQIAEIEKLKKKKSSKEEEGLGDQEDASKQGKKAKIDANDDLSLINETAQDHERMNDEDFFRVNDLDGDEVIMDVTVEVSAAADEVVTTAKSVEGITTATTLQVSKDDVTLAQTLIEIKAAKPKARAKDKGKGIMVEPKKPLKKKDQNAFDEEVTRKLDAQMKAIIKEEEMIAREKDEANKAVIKEWDDVQATIDRLYKVGLTATVESSKEEEGLGDQEDASKQGKKAKIDDNDDLSLINETAQDHGRMNDEDFFRVNDLDGDEVIMDVTVGENVEQDATVAQKEVSAAADEVVTTAKSVEGITTATTLQVSKDDVTLAQTLIEIKAAKPKARAKDKGKGIMVEPKKPLKKKDQNAFDEEVTRKLDAQMKAIIKEEEMIAREKDEANKAVIKEWDDVQATIDV
nr:hypothetical protein [Tanacetum cinerariifolium]